ncbi:Phage portal protein, SPP1 Gp6-like [Mycobacteroides abscessus subsp. abscessus]|nr:Phage portal protein, SPP1 Gp6-like [Mycobacteroides abscessus subsp. abscessus]
MNKVIDFTSERHQRYKKNWNIYENQPDFPRPEDKYVPISLGKEMCELYRDIAFKDNIVANVRNNKEAKEAIDRIVFDNELDATVSEMAISVAAKGDGVFKNYLDDGVSKISYVEPEYYFPEFDPYDKRKIVRETIAFPVEISDGKYELFEEIYEKINGTYWCITKKSDYLEGTTSNERIISEIDTELTQSPLTPVFFGRTTGSFFGFSIFFTIEPILDEFNWKVSQISKILDKFSSPNLIGDPSLLDEGGKFQFSEKSGLYLPVEKDEIEPKYLTWDAQMAANFKYIDEVLLKCLQYVSPLNPSIYGMGSDLASTSARALKVKSWRTANIIENSLKYWERALKKVLLIAQQLEIISGNYNYTPGLPLVECSPSFPIDSYELAQEEQLKVASGVTSIRSSIQRLNPHYSAEQTEDEWLEIIAEKNEMNAQTFMTPLTTTMDTEDEEDDDNELE